MIHTFLAAFCYELCRFNPTERAALSTALSLNHEEFQFQRVIDDSGQLTVDAVQFFGELAWRSGLSYTMLRHKNRIDADSRALH